MGIFKKQTAHHLSVGKRGEAEAEKYLRRHFYRILERNYKTSHYEIDIIASKRRELVFVEVKSRSYKDIENANFGRPSDAIDKNKKRFLLYGIDTYLREHPNNRKHPRIDVIEVYFDDAPEVKKKKVVKLDHIESAFGK